MSESIEVVLLDLGGVMMRLHDPLETFGIDLSHDAFLEKWLLSDSVGKLERGDIAPHAFASLIVREFALPYSPQDFMQRFERWPDTLFDGVPELLQAIGVNHHLALLSNTNAIHWERDDVEGRLEPLIESVFLSYRTGLMKPQHAAFEDVLKKLNVPGDRVLFLDDNILNVNAAGECGMQAMLTRGYDNLAENLGQAGIKI